MGVCITDVIVYLFIHPNEFGHPHELFQQQNENDALSKEESLPDLCDIRFFQVLQGVAGCL